MADYRLKSEKDFNAVFKKGKRLYSEKLTLVYIFSENLKVGYGVGKKHGGSVTRNRIKRLCREAFRNLSDRIEKPCHFVFIPKVSESYDYSEIKKNMEFLLKKGGLLKI